MSNGGRLTSAGSMALTGTNVSNGPRSRFARTAGWALPVLGLVLGCGDKGVDTAAGGGGSGGAGGGGAGGGASMVAEVAFISPAGEVVAEQRYGDAFSIRVEGLEAGGTVTLRTRLWGYQGWGQYVADAGGTVDLREDAPTAGTYAGVEPEGLLWSMERLSNEQEAGYDVTVTAEVAGVEVSSATLYRAPLNQGLVSEPLAEDGLAGTIYKPAEASEPLPALLILGGSEGGGDYPAFRAAYMAGYGYLALGLAYFGVPGLPSELKEIPLEYFETALSYLAARSDVDPQRIAVLGASRGGELALMLGAQFPALHAVVAEVPSGVRWGAVSVSDASAWSWGGTPLPYMAGSTSTQPEQEMLPGGGVGYRLTPVFEAQLAQTDPAVIDAATILVEATNGPVLMTAGDDDGIWPSCALGEIAMQRLEQAGHSAQYQDELICFAASGHDVAMPGWPTTESYTGKIGATTYIYGGTPQGVAAAQRQGLERIRAFLAAEL